MSIQDRHVNLAGFLEGDTNYPMRWQIVQLTSSLSQDEWRAIEYFQLRAREFLLNVEDLNLPRFLSLSINRGGPKAIAQTNMFPGRHRVKSLFLDFRHFLANKEPSKFQRIINIIRKNTDKTHPVQTFLDKLKRDFLKDTNYGIRVNGRELSLSHLVNLWFNTEFFHAGHEDQAQERREWLTVLQDDAAHHLLAWGVVNTAHTVKSLYACVKDLDRGGSLAVNCPDPRLLFRK